MRTYFTDHCRVCQVFWNFCTAWAELTNHCSFHCCLRVREVVWDFCRAWAGLQNHCFSLTTKHRHVEQPRVPEYRLFYSIFPSFSWKNSINSVSEFSHVFVFVYVLKRRKRPLHQSKQKGFLCGIFGATKASILAFFDKINSI